MKSLGLLLGIAALAQASTIFDVSLNTAPLIGHPAGPFHIDFQFTDGSQSGDGNNFIAISNFGFGGGGAAGSPTLFGGAGGNVTSTVTLTDTTPFLNEFIQGFTPGNLLTFQITLSNSMDVGPTPDELSFAILDSTLSNIPSQDPGGSLLIVDIVSPTLVSRTFATDPNQLPKGGGLGIAMNAPVVSTCEPASLSLVGIGLIVLARSRQQRGRGTHRVPKPANTLGV